MSVYPHGDFLCSSSDLGWRCRTDLRGHPLGLTGSIGSGARDHRAAAGALEECASVGATCGQQGWVERSGSES